MGHCLIGSRGSLAWKSQRHLVPGGASPRGRLGEKGGGGFLEVGAVVGMDSGSEGFRRVPNGSPLRDGQHRIR